MYGCSGHQFVDIGSLLDISFALQQHRQHLERRVQLQHVGSSPALQTGNPDTRLPWSASSPGRKPDIPRIDWTGRSVAGSSRVDQGLPGGLSPVNVSIQHTETTTVQPTSRRPPLLLLLPPVLFQILLRELDRLLIVCGPRLLDLCLCLVSHGKLCDMRLRRLCRGHRSLFWLGGRLLGGRRGSVERLLFGVGGGFGDPGVGAEGESGLVGAG
jgi:hypothetical protein